MDRCGSRLGASRSAMRMTPPRFGVCAGVGVARATITSTSRNRETARTMVDPPEGCFIIPGPGACQFGCLASQCVAMEFGLFTEFQCPAGMNASTAFDQSMEQMKAAEDLGFDAVWLAEIHFQKDRSVLSAPLVIASALAIATRRVKIGIAVQVLPLSHPLRLAEDVATVDHLSKGRLEFGIGRSGLPGHYQGVNIPYSESRDRFLETLDILRKAWTQERFTHAGQFWQFNDVCIMPKPYQKPHPPLRVAATTG